jgi:hypothetical protein
VSVLRNPFVVVDDLLVRRNLKLSASRQCLSMSGGVHLYGSYNGTIVYVSERGQEEPATYSCFSKSTGRRERAACKCVANVHALPLQHDQQVLQSAAVPPGVYYGQKQRGHRKIRVLLPRFLENKERDFGGSSLQNIRSGGMVGQRR